MDKRETTKERLVRCVRDYGPDGASVARVEVVDVEIIWPDKKPPLQDGGYYVTGAWQVTGSVKKK